MSQVSVLHLTVQTAAVAQVWFLFLFCQGHKWSSLFSVQLRRTVRFLAGLPHALIKAFPSFLLCYKSFQAVTVKRSIFDYTWILLVQHFKKKVEMVTTCTPCCGVTFKYMQDKARHKSIQIHMHKNQMTTSTCLLANENDTSLTSVCESCWWLMKYTQTHATQPAFDISSKQNHPSSATEMVSHFPHDEN